MNEIQAKGMHELADFLDKLPEENFRMSIYIAARFRDQIVKVLAWADAQSLTGRATVQEQVDCGTACCVAGWSTMLTEGPFTPPLTVDIRAEFSERYGITVPEVETVCFQGYSMTAPQKATQLRTLAKRYGHA